MIGSKVLIRATYSGVHFGTLASTEYTPAGEVVVLENSRRIHYWEGAASLSQIAIDGIKTGRVAVTLPTIKITGVIEVIPLSEEAIENLYNQPVWKV